MKQTRNKGWFAKGRDPRRHKFTSSTARAAGRLGFAGYLARYGSVPQWLITRIKTDPATGRRCH